MKTAQKHPPHNQTEPGLVGPGFIPVFTAKFRGCTPRLCSPGFTLIELMISIALVLILILGVNQIFTYTTQAVGAGQAINAAIRDSRAAQAQLSSDFAAMVAPGTFTNDSASLIIANYSSYGFRDKADMAGDLDGDPRTRDLNNDHVEGDSKVPGEIIQPYQYNYRNHRLDILSFFARDTFHRQTGNPGTFVDNMSAQEAWIWYGHLWLPDNTGTCTAFTFPGTAPVATNPNNYFATQLTLGRMAMLLTPKNSSGTITDNAQLPQWFFDQSTSIPLSPLAYNSPLNYTNPSASSSDPGTSTNVCNARVDLAATSIANFRQTLTTYINLVAGQDWWDLMMDGTTYNSRFQCNPFVAKPMQALDMARSSPYFLGGCSQFIVEFAGDYLTQDSNPSDLAPSTPYTYGQTTSATGDGQLDFVLVPPNGNTAAPRYQWRKQTLWYGMPRNTSGTGSSVNPFINGDVVPLQAWLSKYAVTPQPTNASFERYWPVLTFDGSGNLPVTTSAASTSNYTPYVCAWGPNDKPPSLIRITLTLDDPTGRLPEGQTYQYIFPVPPQ